MNDLYNHYDGSSERCGFILEDGGIVELENISPEPEQGFEIDSQDILRYIDSITAIWHTHPNATSVLSGEDMTCIKQWPDVEHYIVGEDGISVYKVDNGVVVNADYIPR